MTIEVLHDTIVVEDGHLPFGEDYRQKIVVRAFATSGRGDTCRRSRTVVTVGDVYRREGFEGVRKLVGHCRVGNAPKLVTDTVVGGDIDLRLAGCRLRQNGVDLGRVRISAHDRSGLRIDGLDLAYPVVFFHRRRELVFAYSVRPIFGAWGLRGWTRMRMAAAG